MRPGSRAQRICERPSKGASDTSDRMGDSDAYTRFEMVQEAGADVKTSTSMQYNSECGIHCDWLLFLGKALGAPDGVFVPRPRFGRGD